jgi:hypothetical protein
VIQNPGDGRVGSRGLRAGVLVSIGLGVGKEEYRTFSSISFSCSSVCCSSSVGLGGTSVCEASWAYV